MPRRRINPKKKSVRRREVDEWLQSGRGQALLATLELQESCPELTHDAIRRRQHLDESSNSFSFDLSGCSMTALPASIGSWKMSPKPLIELNLSRCTQLTALPEEIGELTTLKEINLEGCASLSVLPDAIGELGALRTLESSECSSLTALPDSIGELGALRRLEVSMCTSLAALPDSIGEIKTLKFLNLSGCVSLSYLPNTIGKLKALKFLGLTKCTSLSGLPDTFNELEALELLHMSICPSLVLSPEALVGLDALRELVISRCDKIGELLLAGLTNLEAIDITNTPNVGFGISAILMLHKQKVKIIGAPQAVRQGMPELRNKAKRRRRRRLCDYCGRQGGIDEPRLPVCYCGERRYCDETCQRAGWAAEHSKTCLFGVFLTAEQIALLQRLEECYSHEMVTDVQYSHFREEYLKMTPAEAQDMFEKARQHMPDGFFSGGPCQWA